ncbi:ferritin-like domain-containing protein [Piscinibacter terrae]|uniref:ferritin-like domain-containing protein n=1 Tax=Piscinibacter terrae TaxID=2496871 RepID=UPI000F5939E6|nr:ferritin-like domain-containing protein [Albitalea terrae]
MASLGGDACHASVPPSVARSLAVFQLGETGGGTVVEQARRSAFAKNNPGYARAMELFVQEEHRHAQVLAMCVYALGGQLIRSNWTDSLFVVVRRAMGLRLKVLVLLAAEVVGISYYQRIAQGLEPSPLRDALEELCADEQSHLHFHCEFLRVQADGPMKRWLFKAAWRTVTAVAQLAVYLEHRGALKDMGVPRSELFARWRKTVEQAQALVLLDDGTKTCMDARSDCP